MKTSLNYWLYCDFVWSLFLVFLLLSLQRRKAKVVKKSSTVEWRINFAPQKVIIVLMMSLTKRGRICYEIVWTKSCLKLPKSDQKWRKVAKSDQNCPILQRRKAKVVKKSSTAKWRINFAPQKVIIVLMMSLAQWDRISYEIAWRKFSPKVHKSDQK